MVCVCFFSADVLDFSEDGLRVVAGVPRRPPQGKPAEKNPDTFRRIFSAHKKVRHNTVLPHITARSHVRFPPNRVLADISCHPYSPQYCHTLPNHLKDYIVAWLKLHYLVRDSRQIDMIPRFFTTSSNCVLCFDCFDWETLSSRNEILWV